MAIIAREPETKYMPAPEGLHPAVCCDVVDLGLVDDGYGEKHKVELRWQLDFVNADTDKRFVVRKRYTLSLHEKASLRKDLETWRGRKFTAQELQGFDLEKLIGITCQVQVIHKILDDGRVFANVAAVIGKAKGTPDLRVVDYTREQDRAKQQGNRVSPSSEGVFGDDVPF